MTYEEARNDLRSRTRLLTGAVLSFVAWPLIGIVLTWLSAVLYRPISFLIPVIGLASWCAAIAAYMYRARFKCPDCGNLYFVNDWLLVNPFRGRCRHCGYNLRINPKSQEAVLVRPVEARSRDLPAAVAPYRRILRTVGTTLIMFGALDIGLMVYSMMNGKSYSSSFNLFAIVLGIFLVRGSLRAANFAALALAFLLGAAAIMAVASPFVFPPGLILARAKQASLGSGTQIAFGIALVAYMVFVLRNLRDPVVRAAQDAAGVKRPRLIFPIMIGGALVGVILGINVSLQSGPAAEHAKQLAEARIGPGYAFYVSSTRYSLYNGRATYQYTLSAWNGDGVIDVPVEWAEE